MAILKAQSKVKKALETELKWLLDSLTISQYYLIEEHNLSYTEKREMIGYLNKLIGDLK